MEISKLEIKRYIDSYKNRLEDREIWLVNYQYLTDNGLHDIGNQIESCVDSKIDIDKIVMIIELMGVKVL